MTQVKKKMPACLLAGLIAVAAAFAIGAFTVQEAHAAELGEGVLYVGGQDIVLAEGKTVKGDDGQGTAVLTYDDGGNPVLTLNNYKCENCTGGGSKTYNAVINYRGTTPFTIQMIGVNAVKSASGNYVYNGILSEGPLVITGDGSLSASGVMQRDYRNYGIVCSKDIWIQSGIVTAIGGDTQESLGSSYGIKADNIIKITGGTVNASGGNAGGDSYGIAGGKGVEITGGNVKAIAGSAGNNYSYGIWGGTTTTIDIGSGVTRVESAGANRALVGIIKNAIPGTGWDSTDGTGDGTLIPDNQSGAYLDYKKVVFEPTLDVKIKGNTSNVKYNGKEQFATGFTAEYKVSDGGWTAKAPDGVSVNLKEGVVAEAKGTNVNTYEMGLTADSFDINPGNYKPGEVIVTDGSLTIGRAPLTITAKNQTLIYNGEIQGPGDTAYNDPAQIAERVTVKGLKGTDQLTSVVVDGQGGPEVGTYPNVLVPGAASIGEKGSLNGNYEITYVEGTIMISAIPLKVTINGSSAKKTYNGKQQTYKGTVTATSKNKAFDAKKFRYKGSTVAKGTKAGVYTKKLAVEGCFYSDPHYELNVMNGSPVKLTVKKAAITIKADSKSSKYGETLKKLTYKVSGAYVKGDKLGVKLRTKAKKNKPGTYKISVSWNKNPNYKATLKTGKYTVGKKPQPHPQVDKAAAKIALDAGVKARSSGSKVTASWGSVKGADSYVIYANYCAKNTACKKIRTVSGRTTSIDITKLNGKKFNPKRNLKFYVVAYQKVNGRNVKLAKSIFAHAPGSKNSKRTNVTAVKVKKSSYTLTKGQTAKIKAKLVLEKKNRKPLKHENKYRYASTNKKVATVSAKGKITAVGKGKCTVYVYAVSGVSKKISVTVR